MQLLEELKHRNVIRVGLAYLAIAWLVLQVLDVVAEILQWPDWLLRLALVALAIGFPIALLLAWFYDITPEGIQEAGDHATSMPVPRLGGRKIDFVIIAALSMVIVVLVLKDAIVPDAAVVDETPPMVSHYEQLTDAQVIFPPTPSRYPIIAGNSRLFFNDFETGELGIQQISQVGGETERIELPEHSSMMVFNPTSTLPDGSGMLLNGFAPGGTKVSVWQLPFIGSSARVLGEGSDAVFSHDGNQIALTDGYSEIYIADGELGNRRKLATAPGKVYWIRWSPENDRLRYFVWGSAQTIWEVSVEGGESRPVFPEWSDIDHCCGSWTKDGRYYVFQAVNDFRTQLWAVREGAGDEKHEPVQITTGPLDFRRPTISPDGTKIIAIGWQLSGETVRLSSVTGEPQALSAIKGIPAEWVSYSRDGEYLAYSRYPDSTIWATRIDGSDPVQLTFDPMSATAPIMSPDGQFVAFVGIPPDELQGVYVVPVAGGESVRVSPASAGARSPSWSPNSQHLAFEFFDDEAIQVYDMATETASAVPGSEGNRFPQWSPDGARFLLSNGNKLWILDLESGEQTTLLQDWPHEFPRWGIDSDVIYVVDPFFMGARRSVHEVSVTTGEERKIAALGNNRVAWGDYGMWVGVTPNGEAMFLRDLSIHHIYALDWSPKTP